MTTEQDTVDLAFEDLRHAPLPEVRFGAVRFRLRGSARSVGWASRQRMIGATGLAAMTMLAAGAVGATDAGQAAVAAAERRFVKLSVTLRLNTHLEGESGAGQFISLTGEGAKDRFVDIGVGVLDEPERDALKPDAPAFGVRSTEWLPLGVSLHAHIPGPPNPDLNKDGVVDAADLSIALAAYGAEATPETDVNGDGAIDGADIRLILDAIMAR